VTIARAIDPTDAEHVTGALQRYVAGRFAAGVTLTERPAPLGKGFDTFIYAFRIAGPGLDEAWARPLVLRLYGSAEQSSKCEREAVVQGFAASLGYPALLPLAVEGDGGTFGLPFMIMPRVSGGTVLDAIMRNPLRARSRLGEMARLHARLHDLPIDGCPLRYERPLIESKLEQLGAAVRRIGRTGLRDGLRWLGEHRSVAGGERPALCHGDFHPLNVLLGDNGEMAVIDWTDGTIGDRHSDVARTVALLQFAHIAAGSAIERLVLRVVRRPLRSAYYNAYHAAAPVEPARMRYWETVQTFWGWVQLADVGIPADADVAGTTPQPEAARRIPANLIDELERRFWRLTRGG
jgi:aminoglycoside phosphotransferase (APT) family kinase protein